MREREEIVRRRGNCWPVLRGELVSGGV